MKILRSWPAVVPAGRAGYVVDDLPRLVIDRYDLRDVGRLDDDVLLLEWDIAIGREDLIAFAQRARRAPKQVLVAPYRLYFEHENVSPITEPMWVHRRFVEGITPGGPVQVRGDTAPSIAEGDPFCHLFGLGMTYLPRHLIRGFIEDHLAANPNSHFGDHTFSEWHFHHADDPDVPITWDIRPVHLHYSTHDLEL